MIPLDTTSGIRSGSVGGIDSTLPPTSQIPLPLPSLTRRGAFVLLEGVDRCGKTTQCARLMQRLVTAGLAATAMRFPDRTTATGAIINQYLQSTDLKLDDHAIHLLFSANRWESAPQLQQYVRNGTTVVCDRYAYSGVAFSAAKVDEATKKPILDLEWCQAPDRGLPAPDVVIFLDLSADEAEQRGGFGGERYETRDMQLRVRQQFQTLQQLDEKEANGQVVWKIVNAAQSIDQVEEDIWSVVQKTIQECGDQPIRTMWQNDQQQQPASP